MSHDIRLAKIQERLRQGRQRSGIEEHDLEARARRLRLYQQRAAKGLDLFTGERVYSKEAS